MTNSRAKGAAGEREVRDVLRRHGFDDARRGQQYCGANGDADVVGLPGIHIEVKRVEQLRLESAMQQSRADAKVGEIPIVVHRKNRGKWMAIMDMDDFMDMYKYAQDAIMDRADNERSKKTM